MCLYEIGNDEFSYDLLWHFAGSLLLISFMGFELFLIRMLAFLAGLGGFKNKLFDLHCLADNGVLSRVLLNASLLLLWLYKKSL